MTKLASKSGWLYKRNEQNKWQKRWCCVVPHTFLYYFDSEPVDDDDDMVVYDVENYTVIHQEATPITTNRKSSSNSGEHEKNGSSSGWCAQDAPVPISSPQAPPRNNVSSGVAPVGIIDLECYSSVNRDLIDILPAEDPDGGRPFLMELAADIKVNPDLRSFYFQSKSHEECLEWSKYFLYERQHFLRDERDAYQQICESFPVQLSNLNGLINKAESEKKEVEVSLNCNVAHNIHLADTLIHKGLYSWNLHVSDC